MKWYDEKLNFEEVLKKYGADVVYGPTAAANDLVTQAILLEWFFDYKTAPDDPDVFLRYFRRRLNDLYPRYLNQLRIMTVAKNMDPFIVHYFEKQERGIRTADENSRLEKTGTVSREGTTSGSTGNTTVRTPELESETTDSSHRTGETTGTSDSTRTPLLKDETVHSGTDKTVSKADGTTAGTTGSTTEAETSGESTRDTKAKAFGLAYPEANMEGLPVNLEGMEAESLDYVSNGQYTLSQEADTRSETSSTSVTGNSTGEKHDTGESTVTYDTKDTVNRTGTEQTLGTTGGTSKEDETGSSKTTSTGHETTTDTGTSSSTSSDTSTSNGTDTGSKTTEDKNRVDTRELGRDESVADILPRAIAALQGTDELQWFISAMEACFDCTAY